MGTKNNPGAFDCYANAEPDEPMFVLLARDLLVSGERVFLSGEGGLPGGFFARRNHPRLILPKRRCPKDGEIVLVLENASAYSMNIIPVLQVELEL